MGCCFRRKQYAVACYGVNLTSRDSLQQSPEGSLQQHQNFFLIQTQLFFFTLGAEQGHAVGEWVPFSADVILFEVQIATRSIPASLRNITYYWLNS